MIQEETKDEQMESLVDNDLELRLNGLKTDKHFNLERNDVRKGVSKLIHQHILAAEELIPEPTEAANLFLESSLKKKWIDFSNSHFSSLIPSFFHSGKEASRPCSEDDVSRFIKKIFYYMELETELMIVALIYLEKIIATSSLEIRYSNWRPLVFTSIMLASKFIKDIHFWNADFSQDLNMYSKKSLKVMEEEFFSHCDYNLFVSELQFTECYESVRQVLSRMQTKNSKLK